MGLRRAAAASATESMVIATGIHHGFVAPDLGLAVLGEQEIAGRRRAHRRVPPVATGSVGAAATPTCSPGDYVVHHRHGIGRFEGLVTQRLGGVERDYLLVAYAGQDRLYVPTDQLAAVRRYTGGEAPRLSRMGGADWERTQDRVRAERWRRWPRRWWPCTGRRARASGHAFPSDTPWQREMEAAFPYEETPDQVTAIADVKADMESEAPMDRLVFGDVGFGKTEVAMRAAFKAVQDGKPGGGAGARPPCSPSSTIQTFSDALRPLPGAGRGAEPLPHHPPAEGGGGRGLASGDGGRGHRHPPPAQRGHPLSRTSACSWWTRSSASGWRPRTASRRCAPRWTC